MPEALRSGTVLAFDFGAARTGVAVGDTALAIAHPLTTITTRSSDECLAQVEALIKEWQPVHLVVGLPCHADGTPHEMTARARKFAQRLKGRFGRAVWLVDERYTSEVAETMLGEAGVQRGRKQKPALDQVAAQVILTTWFDYAGEAV